MKLQTSADGVSHKKSTQAPFLILDKILLWRRILCHWQKSIPVPMSSLSWEGLRSFQILDSRVSQTNKKKKKIPLTITF